MLRIQDDSKVWIIEKIKPLNKFLVLKVISLAYWVTSTSKNKTMNIRKAGNMATNGAHIGSLLSAPLKFLPSGDTNQLARYLVGIKLSGISNF